MNKLLPNSEPIMPGVTLRPVQQMLGLLLIFVLGLSGCASQSPLVVQPKPVRLSPPPPELMEREQPTLRQRLLKLSGQSPQTGTGPSGN